jgi:GNAT acetyltransferase-like protein
MTPTESARIRPISCLDLMRLHVDACYVHDTNHRLVTVNEWSGGAAPRFWIGRTKDGVIWRFGVDVPADVSDRLSQLCRNESATSDLPAPLKHETAYRELLAGPGASERVTAGPTYWLPTSPRVVSNAVAVASRDRHLLQGTLDDWIPDLERRSPIFVSLSKGRAAAVCASVRMTDAADEAGIETASAFRRQGHAINAAAGWASAVQLHGKTPLYSASWENQASQGLARKLGFEMFGEEFTVR